MTLHLHIERVVLDGADPDLRLSPSQRAALLLSLRQALGPAFTGWRPGAWLLQPRLSHLDGGTLPAATSPARVGEALATTLRQSLAAPPTLPTRRRP